MFATTFVLALLSTVASAAPLPSITSYNSTSLVHSSSAGFYNQNGIPGSCGDVNTDEDLVLGLPTNVSSGFSSCGKYVNVTNTANGKSVISRVVDTSSTNDFVILSVAAWNEIEGNDGIANIEWFFINATPVEATATIKSRLPTTAASFTSRVVAAVTHNVNTATSSLSLISVPGASTTASTTSLASSSSSSVWVSPTTSSTTSTWVRSTSTLPFSSSSSSSAWVEPTTTTQITSTWVAPTTTTTWVPQTTSSQQSSGGSGTFSGKATYFYQYGSPGHCGKVNSDSAYIVALDTALYGNGNHCGQQLRINYNGKSIVASVADSCPGCGSHSLDLSEAAFKALGNLDQGVLPITWSWI